MSRVFTADAMAACERLGHSMHWVATWHAAGFDECLRCGETRAPLDQPGAVESVPGHRAESEGLRERDAASPILSGSPHQERRAHAAPSGTPGGRDSRERPAPSSRARSSAAERPVVNRVVGGSIPPERATPRRNVVGAAAVARNAEIVRRWQTGESSTSIARDLGLHKTRVAQIARGDALPPRPDNAARDAEIVRRAAAGELRAALAAEFGLHIARIDQITRAARRSATPTHAGELVGATAGAP